jgi:RNA polymerase sigma-70 factor (ECF subfamily)
MVEVFVERRPEGLGEPDEEAAFADLYNRTYGPLVMYCRRYCPPGYDAEDIAQEALSRAWSSWDRYSRSRPFWPWVATIARRLCVDYWRRDERAVARSAGVAVLDPVVQPRPDELSEAADDCRMAVKAFHRLRPDHQRIVGLRDIEGWSYEDIARFEGVTVESVRGSLRRARLSLRKSYETLTKGGVAILLPLVPGGMLQRFQGARVRLAQRMARWQAALHDTGVASTRLGEALVSLMALSVAVVGLGAPGGGAAAHVERTDGSSPSSAAAVGAPDAAGLGRGAALHGAGAGAGAGGGDSGERNVTPEWASNAAGFMPAGMLGTSTPDGPQNTSVYHFTLSPDFSRDGVIFAAGGGQQGCPALCGTLFKSTDRGRTWQGLRAADFNGDRVLLPPAFPADNRIFATGLTQLQVSLDGGDSFIPLAPSLGPAVMSPGFSGGDRRILFNDAPGRQYDDRLGATTPLDLRPDTVLASQRFSFSFPSAFDARQPVMFVGSSQSTMASPQPARVSRCEGSVCTQAALLPGTLGPPTLLMARAGGVDALLAYSGTLLFRSVDGAATFQAVALPAGVTGILDATVDASGAVSLVTSGAEGKNGLWRTADAGANWSSIPTAGIPVRQITTLQALPDGTLLVGLSGEVAGLACSHDAGATWSPHC